MDDPDISVALVKLESIDKEEGVDSASNWIGSAKDCHMLWDSLRQQSQLFKVLDTLTSKTAQLIRRLQNQTAAEEDSLIAVELLSQLGILFIDVETHEDGSKEKRYTFVTDNEVSLPPQPIVKARQAPPEPESLPPEPVTPVNASDSDTLPDDFEPESGDDANSEKAVPKTYICDWCKEDQGTPVMLDLHKLSDCEILKKSRSHGRAMSCPTCGVNFRQLACFYSHLLEEHRLETSKAIEVIREVQKEKHDEDKKQEAEETEEIEDEHSTSSSEEKDRSQSSGETTPKPNMKCEVCKDGFGTRIDLRTHLMEGHNYSRQKAVSSVYQSSKLAVQKENDQQPTNKVAKVSDKVLKCADCDTILNDRTLLVQHLRSAHDIPRYKAEKLVSKQCKDLNAKFVCDLCTSKYVSRYSFSKHLTEIHNLSKKETQRKLDLNTTGTTETATGKSKLSCDLCVVTCVDRSVLSRHFMNKHGFSKIQAAKKTAKLYPKLTKPPKEKEGIKSGSSVQQLQSSSKSGKETNKHERTSRRLALKEKEVDKRREKEEDDSHEDGEDETSMDQTSDQLEKQMNNTGESGDKDSRRKTTVIADEKQMDQEHLDEDGDGDEDYVPEDISEDGDDNDDYVPEGMRLGRKHAAKKKPGRKSGWTKDMVEHKCPHPHCDKVLKDLYLAKVHMTTVHKKAPPYQCSTCQKPFYYRNTFLRHLTCHRNQEMGIEFICDICNKSFFDKYSLATHVKIHSMENLFKCDYCSKDFSHKSQLSRHLNLHTRNIEYKCDICDRVFYRKGGLTYHKLAIHEQKRDYVCSQCGTGFASKSTLVAHEHSHNTIRPFQCDICGTRVKTKGNLKEHMLCVHTNKRDFKCEVCQKTFNRSHRLTLHMMMHRDERPHKCHLCEKGFRTRTNLRVHVKWHQNERDFQCEQCGKTFLIPGNLDRHMQTHKNGKNVKKRQVKKGQTTTEAKTLEQPNGRSTQNPVVAEVCSTVDNQFQTVTNLVAGGGFESDLPTLASIAQHLSTMNIPVFQVPTSSTEGAIHVPATIGSNESTCTTLPGSVISREASMAALAVLSQAQQLQTTPDNRAVQGEFVQMELSM